MLLCLFILLFIFYARSRLHAMLDIKCIAVLTTDIKKRIWIIQNYGPKTIESFKKVVAAEGKAGITNREL